MPRKPLVISASSRLTHTGDAFWMNGVVRMSVSSGEKRRRKRDRRFVQFYDALSMRATFAAVGGSIALLAWIAARSVFFVS